MKTATASARVFSVMDYIQLTKPRITFLVVLTTFIGFLLGSTGPIEYVLLLHTILGTAMVAAGASALNMVLESDADARMRRTENRPIPSGQAQQYTGAFFWSDPFRNGLVIPCYVCESINKCAGCSNTGSVLVRLHSVKKEDIVVHSQSARFLVQFLP